MFGAKLADLPPTVPGTLDIDTMIFQLWRDSLLFRASEHRHRCFEDAGVVTTFEPLGLHNALRRAHRADTVPSGAGRPPISGSTSKM